MNDFDTYDEPSMRTMRGDTNEGTLGRIDQYEIIRKLGGGGFGVVYLVRDTQSDVEYAIKTLHPLLKSNLEEMENLRSQFKLISKLSHPYIASAMYLHPVKEVVYVTEEVRKELRLSSGDFVMVMKYAPGVTLSNWRKQFPNKVVPVDWAIGICSHIASALDYAHSVKIIHRDIKPSNIMIETREDGVVARVLDFGLAAEIRSSMSRVSTEQGDTSGTRPYMAPEQWMGKRQGTATDQYALACLFYELVSGWVPFAGAFETGDFQVMFNSVSNLQPEILDELSEEQNNVLQKALAKNQKDRFVLCMDFINALNGENLQQITNDVSQPQPNSSKKVKCKKCGTENFVTTMFCPECGAKVERDDICLQCGVDLEPNQKFCKICGAKTPILVAQEQAEQERKASEELEHKNRNEAEKKEADEITKNNPQQISEIIGNMVRIPDNAKHKGLYFSKYQVTQAQWQAIMGNNPSHFRGDLTRPVEMVSWYDCQKFIKKLNSSSDVKASGLVFSLPTQEEWVYACLARGKGKYGLVEGSREGKLNEMGWFNKNSGYNTHPVGQKKPNAWGLYDMHGNVWEWTSSAKGDNRVRCGGSYCNEALHCVADEGNRCNMDIKSYSLGLRLIAKTRFDASKIVSEKKDYKSNFIIKNIAEIDMVSIPDNAEHKGLYIGKYQVTQAQWQAIMGNNPSHFRGDLARPVEMVSWYDCQKFIKKLNSSSDVKASGLVFSLPTQEEWVYACRAGSTGKYGLLENYRKGKLNEMGWFDKNSGNNTHPVGQKKPNAWGLYDMHGNVWEWTSSAGGEGRIRCGGCYCNEALHCGANEGWWNSPDDRYDGIGFRLAAKKNKKK